MNKSDKTFMSHFSMVIGALVIMTLVIIFLARYVADSNPNEHKPEPTNAQSERIAPVGKVQTGEVSPVQVAVVEEAAPAGAFNGTLDGAVIYQNVCFACHNFGAAGAPKLEAAAWVDRLPQGVEALNQHAIDGYQGIHGYMPPKGGNALLSDEQVAAAVQHMISESQ